MKWLLVIAGFVLIYNECSSQIKGQIFLNGKKFEAGSDSNQSFNFKPLSSKISRKGKRFLTEFTRFYELRSALNDSVMIIIDPAETIKEYKIVYNSIAQSRAQTVINFLRRKFKVDGLKIDVYQKQLLHSVVIKGTLKPR